MSIWNSKYSVSMFIIPSPPPAPDFGNSWLYFHWLNFLRFACLDVLLEVLVTFVNFILIYIFMYYVLTFSSVSEVSFSCLGSSVGDAFHWVINLVYLIISVWIFPPCFQSLLCSPSLFLEVGLGNKSFCGKSAISFSCLFLWCLDLVSLCGVRVDYSLVCFMFLCCDLYIYWDRCVL